MTSNALDWKTYEELTMYIYQALGEKAGVTILGHGNDCKVKGKSNVEHQIDVLTSHSDGIHTYKTAIECKYWKTTVNKDIVMKVAEIIEDSGLNKGVIVSKEGYTPDALSYARYKNIGLIELREMREDDDIGSSRVYNIRSFVLRAEILSVTINPSIFDRSMHFQEQVEPNTIEITTYGGERKTMREYIKEFEKTLYDSPVDKIIEKKVVLPLSTMINTKTQKRQFIDGFIVTGKLRELPGPQFKPLDEVWLIMKSIFDEKLFTISKAGFIKEIKTEAQKNDIK